MDGMETLRRLRQKSDLPVIFLTSKEEQIDELFGLKMGADDFIRKPFSQRLLAERIKTVLRRASPKDGAPAKEADSKVLERGQLRMDPERHTCTWKNELVTLTVTEFLILQALASRPGVVKSRNALMDAAYDDQVYGVAAAMACARAGQLGRGHDFLERAEYGAGRWRGGPWSAAVAEARAELLLAEDDDHAAADALRRAAEGYAAAGQLLNERRAREALERIDGATVRA